MQRFNYDRATEGDRIILQGIVYEYLTSPVFNDGKCRHCAFLCRCRVPCSGTGYWKYYKVKRGNIIISRGTKYKYCKDKDPGHLCSKCAFFNMPNLCKDDNCDGHGYWKEVTNEKK